ncbi:hypothetical protein [Paraburkholderia bryophila]|uniref:7-cyano-7-deazaguanine synthase in queuosine biosynthesis n=1 Tax=Paraburkholderia bryophila TaxID=420952 RepID=A0A329CGN9_9BURK|nr:hypothetical protein [Paraburkholderia bryophila]RAS33147.1 hypothetical protein BX591_10764 [Paraburkholderia bryophila]
MPVIDIPVTAFRVTTKRARKSAKVEIIRLGEDIQVDASTLSEYAFQESDGIAHDLMTLIGAVKFADRSLRRHHAKSWTRRIHIEIPVFKLNAWLMPGVRDALVQCLNYLTGDSWSFEFVARDGAAPALQQSPLSDISLRNRDIVFVPFSHGLDSYGQVRLLQLSEPETEVVCVYADARSAGGHRSALQRKNMAGVQYVGVPVKVRRLRHPEGSFRSRPFMFYLLASLGAIASGGNRVMIPENGQGSIGGSLVTTGHEPKHRSCYPGFTAKLSNFLKALTGSHVAFYHPALFETKGSLLRALAEHREDVRAILSRHPSCSCDARLASHDQKKYHCGICGNCLLRRAAEHSARLEDGTEYLFNNLKASSLEDALRPGDNKVKLKFFGDLARNGVRDMQRLADAGTASQRRAVQAAAIDLSRFVDDDIAVTTMKLSGLLEQHALEWSAFLATCGQDSWISKIARG